MFYFGLITLSLAFLAALAAIITTLVHLAHHEHELSPLAETLAKVSFAAHTLSVLSLVMLQLLEDYSIAYVDEVISTSMPAILKMTALWGGQAGSLFFWSWVINLVIFIALVNRHHLLDGWGFLTAGVTLTFFSGLCLLIENPFSRVWLLGSDRLIASPFSPMPGATLYTGLTGSGLNPLLRHAGMVIHPPILYLGMALFLIPFSVGLSQLFRGEFEEGLFEQTRTWLLSAWVLLTAGIVIGSWWSYDVLGWGGYWAWDPVETASFLPWLSGTALFHSLILQRDRKIFRRFNLMLVLLTFLLVIFSVFTTRSGVISSVHAFGESSISTPLLAFTVVLSGVSLVLLILRWKKLASGWELDSFFNREALILYADILLLAILLVCLYGLLFPLISNAITGGSLTLGKAFFNRTTAPLFIALVVLMGICPLVGWTAASLKKLGRRMIFPLGVALVALILCYLSGITRFSSLLGIFIAALGLATNLALTYRDAHAVGLGKFFKLAWKQRARYGAYLVHTGILLIALGITGMETMTARIEGTMLPGERMPLRNFEFEFVGISASYENPEYLSVIVDGILYRDGVKVAQLHPGQHIYMEREQSMTIPAAYSTLRGDLYSLLIGYDVSVPYATIQLSDNPLVNFLWIGGGALVLGGILATSFQTPHLRDDEEAPDAAGQPDEKGSGLA